MTEGPLCVRFVGLLIDKASGEQAPLVMEYDLDEESQYSLDLEVRGVRTHHEFGFSRAPGFRTVHARCFGRHDGGERVCGRDPVNIDGSPHRPRLADRWKAKWEQIESHAAD